MCVCDITEWHMLYIFIYLKQRYFKRGHKLRRLLTDQLRWIQSCTQRTWYPIFPQIRSRDDEERHQSGWDDTDYLLPFPSSSGWSYCVIFLRMIGSPLLLRMCSHVTRSSGLLPTVHRANVLLVPKLRRWLYLMPSHRAHSRMEDMPVYDW